jgi:hypothetical protein
LVGAHAFIELPQQNVTAQKEDQQNITALNGAQKP